MPLIENVLFRRSGHSGLLLGDTVHHFNVTGLRFEGNRYAGLFVAPAANTMCTLETCHVTGNTFTGNTYGIVIAGLPAISPRAQLWLGNNTHSNDNYGYVGRYSQFF